MPLPEQGTPERVTAEERIEKRLRDLAYFPSRKLGGDSRFHILFRDKETGEKVAAFANSRHKEGQGIEISFESQGVLPSEETVLEAIDILLKTNPETPMICDNSILGELFGDSLRLVEKDHFQFTGNPRGTLEIYAPPSVDIS
jgi:hypothetical protein